MAGEKQIDELAPQHHALEGFDIYASASRLLTTVPTFKYMEGGQRLVLTEVV